MASNNGGGYAALRSYGGGGGTKAAKSGGYGALEAYKSPKPKATAEQIPNLNAPGGSTAGTPNNSPKGPSLFNKVGHVIGAVGSALTSGEQVTAKAVARELPGGRNDLIAAQNQADQAVQNIKQIQGLQKQGKIAKPTAAKIIQDNANTADQAQQTVKNTVKAMPTTKQLAGGLASTASDIITGGGGTLLKEVKAGSVIRKIPELSPGLKKLQKVIVGTGAAVSGGGSAVASGATGKQAGVSAVLGAALPIAGLALTKVFQRGSKAALAELSATRENVAKGVGAIANKASTDTSKVSEQKLLNAGPVANESTATVGASAGTLHTVPMTDEEYNQRFNDLSKSYDKATNTVASMPAKPAKASSIQETFTTPDGQKFPAGTQVSQIAQHYKSGQEFIDQSAKSLQNMDKGLKGGQLVSTNQKYGYGMTRTTEHTLFYSQLYKNLGHAPSLKDYKNAVEDELSSGSSHFLYPEEHQIYKQVVAREKAPVSPEMASLFASDPSLPPVKAGKAGIQKGTFEQSVAMQKVHDEHLAALEQLNHEYIHGKPNPDFVPAEAGTQTPTGFTMGAKPVVNAADASARQAVHIQISGLDKQLSDIRENGLGNRSVRDVRNLMAQRQGLVDKLEGKAPLTSATPAVGEIKPMPFGQAVPRNAAEVTTPEHIANVTPSIVDNAPKVAEGNHGQAILNRQMVVDAYNRMTKPVKDAAKGMSQHDIGLIDKIEGDFSNADQASAHFEKIASQADNPKQFRDVVNTMRGGYNTRLAGDLSLGRDVGLRHNYLPHMFDRTDQKTADALDALDKQKTHMINNALPGYTKQRTVESYDVANRLGLKRANANALEDYYKSMANAGQEHGAAVLKNGLEEAHPGMIQVGKIGRGADGEMYKGLEIAGGKTLSAPEDLAKQINNRAQPDYAHGVVGKTGKAYDTGNAFVKYAKLGGGFFHAFTTAGSTAGQQLLSGHTYAHPIETAIQNLRLVKNTVSRGAHDKSWESLANNGDSHVDGLSTRDRMSVAGVTTRPEQILADANVFKKSQHSKFNPIAQVHDLVFQRQIPEAKAMMFEQATRDLNINKPEDLARMRQVASQVNNLGGINRAVNGLTPRSAKWLSRAVLATDFTEGKFRTLGTALNLTRWDRGARMARQMVVGKTILFTLPGLLAAVHSGRLDPTDPKAVEAELTHQILDPSIALNSNGQPTKSNPGGTPQEAKLPKTFISELASIIQPALSSTSTNRASGLKDYASARLAALPSAAEQLKTNTDFYGNPIYGTDKQGNPISGGKAALNVASQIAPIPAVQLQKTKSGQQNAATAVLNTAGFRVANNPTSAEAQHSGAVNDFYNTYNKAYSARNKVAKQTTQLIMSGNVNQARRIAETWNNTIAGRISPFRDKYAANYNPAWDTEFQKLVIPTSGRAFTSRYKAGQQASAILQ